MDFKRAAFFVMSCSGKEGNKNKNRPTEIIWAQTLFYFFCQSFLHQNSCSVNFTGCCCFLWEIIEFTESTSKLTSPPWEEDEDETLATAQLSLRRVTHYNKKVDYCTKCWWTCSLDVKLGYIYSSVNKWTILKTLQLLVFLFNGFLQQGIYR